MSRERPSSNGAITNDFPTSRAEMDEMVENGEFEEDIGTVGSDTEPDTPRVYNQESKDNEEKVKTDGGVAAGNSSSYLGAPDQPMDLYRAICSERVWNESQHELQVPETEFTLKDVAVDLDDPDSFHTYDWDSLEEKMDEAVEAVNNLYKTERTVDIDKTTEDEVYAEVTFYGLEDRPNGPMGI